MLSAVFSKFFGDIKTVEDCGSRNLPCLLFLVLFSIYFYQIPRILLNYIYAIKLKQIKMNCVKKLNYFCYICGKFTIKVSKIKLDGTLKKAYEQYFGENIIKNVSWAPRHACKTCYNRLLDWWKGKRVSMSFGVPMIWSDPTTHTPENCYVCKNYLTGMNRRKKRSITYLAVPSAQTPLPHSDAVPVPQRRSPSTQTVTTFEDFASVMDMDPSYLPSVAAEQVNLISQRLLDKIVSKLELSQKKAETLASILSKEKLLAQGVKITAYRSRQKMIQQFFSVDENNSFAYCNNVKGLMEYMNIKYDPRNWRLFIDSSKTGLKAVILHYKNKKPSIPIAYSTSMKECYDTMKTILEAVGYEDHAWRISCDFKVINILCGLQLGYTKHMCFLCKWDTRFQGDQYLQFGWAARENFILGKENVLRAPLVDTKKILLPPLHIKLGVVKNFVKKLNRDGPAFKRLTEVFPRLSAEKIKEGVFNGPDIRRLMKDEQFLSSLVDYEKDSWEAIMEVIKNFLGIHRAPNYPDLIKNMLDNFHKMGVSMSLKIHFLHAHLDFFEQQMPSESDEHGERFHQTIMPMEIRYQGKKLDAMLADLCWWVKNLHEDEESSDDESNNDDNNDESSSSDNNESGGNGGQITSSDYEVGEPAPKQLKQQK